MTRNLTFCLLAAWMACGAPSLRAGERWMLDWSEEFSRSGLVDEGMWDYEHGFMRNREPQYYVPRRRENCRVEKGRLVLTARREQWKNEWYFPGNGNWAHQIEYASFTSASITTRRKFGYGRFEIRAKLPARANAWPALWLLGDICRRDLDDPTREDWPACGEIDLAEIWGSRPDRLQGTLHSPEGDFAETLTLEKGAAFDDGYHVYVLDWHPGGIEMYFDGRQYFSRKTDYFNRPMFLIVNLALDGGEDGASVDANEYPIEMKVDYIRHYVRVPETEDQIRLVSPKPGKVVSLVPDCQKAMLSTPDYAARLKKLQEDKASGGPLSTCSDWRRSRPVKFAWSCAEGQKGPWHLRVATDEGLVNGVDRYFHEWEAKPKGGVCRREIPDLNLEAGRRYWWRVSSRGTCGKYGCGPFCGCEASKRVVASDVGSFTTEDRAPRWIALEGRVENVRDLGGQVGLDGRRVRQGLAFRGQGLNDNSVSGERAGCSRLTCCDVRYLRDTLGIRTDLDLRNEGETADLFQSPIGPDVRLIKHPSQHYRDVFTPEGMRTMARNFRVFCKRGNYPIYFHCISGADRTGSLTYMLYGALGVSKEAAEVDWEMTFYPELPEMAKKGPGNENWRSEQQFESGLLRYGGENATWNERVVAYLRACGITDAEIDGFRNLMLEPERGEGSTRETSGI